MKFASSFLSLRLNGTPMVVLGLTTELWGDSHNYDFCAVRDLTELPTTFPGKLNKRKDPPPPSYHLEKRIPYTQYSYGGYPQGGCFQKR